MNTNNPRQSTSASLGIITSRTSYLVLAAIFILFFMLGYRELWTQEGRWAVVVLGMQAHHDIWHPYLYDHPYYDKPLFSYWLTLFFSSLLQGFNEWALRLPSVLASLLIIYCTYWLGKFHSNRQVGLLAGWMLITTFLFIFWSRTAGADMLNIAGVLAATAWYFAHRDHPNLFNYIVFFAIIAITCLCKGLLGFMLTGIAVLPDLLHGNRWRQHVNLSFAFGLAIGIGIYLLPFLASSWFNPQHFAENGLAQVYHENILRFIKPFDHEDPIYTYFIYLPIYLLPWTFFFIPAIFSAIKNWHHLSVGERWPIWVTLLLFIFFSASGSRRSYYILPILPFAILMTANWILSVSRYAKLRQHLAKGFIILSYIILISWFVIIQFLTNDHNKGIWQFATEVRAAATQQLPWAEWHIAVVDSQEKPIFYLHPLTIVTTTTFPEILQANFGVKNPHTIIITRPGDLFVLKSVIANYQIIVEPNNQKFAGSDDNSIVALVPYK